MELYKITDGQILKIAFAVLLHPHIPAKYLSGITSCFSIDRTPIIYPFFDTRYENGELEVFGSYDITEKDDFINIFGVAQSIYNAHRSSSTPIQLSSIIELN